MERQLKYIIYQQKNEKYFSGGYVEFHRQLAPEKSRTSFVNYDVIVLGGGKFDVDDDNKQIIFYGSSDDFGSVDKKLLKKVLEDCRPHVCDDIWYALEHKFRCTHDRDDYHMNEFGEISSPDWKYENENFMDYKFIIE
jgi:hypothetical protein